MVNTLNGKLDEPSTLSIGVDGMTGEEDRISSLCWIQLEHEQASYNLQTSHGLGNEVDLG